MAMRTMTTVRRARRRRKTTRKRKRSCLRAEHVADVEGAEADVVAHMATRMRAVLRMVTLMSTAMAMHTVVVHTITVILTAVVVVHAEAVVALHLLHHQQRAAHLDSPTLRSASSSEALAELGLA